MSYGSRSDRLAHPKGPTQRVARDARRAKDERLDRAGSDEVRRRWVVLAVWDLTPIELAVLA